MKQTLHSPSARSSRAALSSMVLAWCLLGPVTVSVAAIVPEFTIENGVRVVQGQQFTDTVRISGAEWDGAIIRNNQFAGQIEHGLTISDVKNLIVEDNSFTGMARNAIKLEDVQTTGALNVTIADNRFEDIAPTPILVGAPNPGVRILRNQFRNVGYDLSGEKQHAMYIKAPGYLVEGNVIDNVGGYNGISIRTAGIVRGNWLINVKSEGIKYYSDGQDKGDGKLLIENNVVINSGRSGIGFDTGAGVLIDQAVVRFNTLVNNYRALRFGTAIYPVNFTIYGNILIESSGNYTYGTSGLTQLLMVDNIQSTQPGDLFVDFAGLNVNLRPGVAAIRSVQAIASDPFGPPTTDYFGIAYDTPPHDAGACRYHLPSPKGLTLTVPGG